MKKILFQVCFAVAAMCAAFTVSAALVYGNPALGTYYGSGNPAGEWWVDTTGGVELALRAKDRASGGLFGNGADGIYNVPAGTCTGGLCGSSTNKAWWNYDFSVDPGTFQGLMFRLGVDHDPSLGVNYSYVDPAAHWADETYMGAAFQNSQNVKFGSTPGGPFDVSQQGLYNFTLEAWLGNRLFSSVTTQVQVGEIIPESRVSEPTSVALFGLGLAGMIIAFRRQKEPKQTGNQFNALSPV